MFMKLKLPPWGVFVPSRGSSEFTVVCRSGWWPTCPRSPWNKIVIESSVAIVELVIVTFLWHIFEHKCILSHALSFSVLLPPSLICNSKWSYFQLYASFNESQSFCSLCRCRKNPRPVERRLPTQRDLEQGEQLARTQHKPLCLIYRVILFDSLYIMDFMYSLCTGTGCIWNLSNPILPKKCLVPLKFVNGF